MPNNKIVNLKDFKENKDKNNESTIEDILTKTEFNLYYTCVYFYESSILKPFEIYVCTAKPDVIIFMVMYSEFVEDDNKTHLYLTANFYNGGASEIFFTDSNTRLVFQNHTNVLMYSTLLIQLISLAKSYFE